MLSLSKLYCNCYPPTLFTARTRTQGATASDSWSRKTIPPRKNYTTQLTCNQPTFDMFFLSWSVHHPPRYRSEWSWLHPDTLKKSSQIHICNHSSALRPYVQLSWESFPTKSTPNTQRLSSQRCWIDPHSQSIWWWPKSLRSCKFPTSCGMRWKSIRNPALLIKKYVIKLIRQFDRKLLIEPVYRLFDHACNAFMVKNISLNYWNQGAHFPFKVNY